MKKKLLSILLALCGAFVFTACGGGNGDSVVPDNSSTPAASTPTDSTPADTTPAEPVLQDMDTAFSGAKILWEKSHLSAMNSPSKTFEEIVDQQLELLAQDLVFRLNYIYGARNFNENEMALPGGYNGAPAIVKAENMIADVAETFDSLTEINLNDEQLAREAFQKSIVLVDGKDYLNRSSALKVVGAILGENAIIEYINGTYAFAKDESKKWASACDEMTVALLKQELLSLMADTDCLNLGGYKTQIADLIFNRVIGSALVAADNEYYQLWIDQYGGMINSENLTSINLSQTLEAKAPRLYKGYSIIIPAIIEQALANTFENTDVCIYPVVNRYAVNTINHYRIDGSSTMREAVLMPKAGEVGVLTVFVEGSEDFTLSYDVAVNGVVTSKTAQVVLTDGKATVDLDISETFGAYNGNANSYTDDYIYGNSGADSHGDNYILFYYDREDMHLWFKGVK